MKTNKFMFDFSNKTITVSATTAKRMTNVGTAEYKQFAEHRRNFNDFAIVVLPSKKNNHKGLTIAKMETIIKEYDPNPIEALKEFKYVLKCGELRRAKAAYARSYFLEKKATYLEEYDSAHPQIDDAEDATEESA